MSLDFHLVSSFEMIQFSRRLRKSVSVSLLVLLLGMQFSACPVQALERIDVSGSESSSKTSGAESGHMNDLLQIDREIMLKSINLHQLIARSETEALKKYRFRKWIDIAGQETSAAGLLAATAVGVDELGPKLNRPLAIRINRLKRGLNAGIVTSIIGASASASQLGLDVVNRVREGKEGYSPGAVRKRFVAGMLELDQLYAKRARLLQDSGELLNSDVVAAATELLLVRRELLVKEFMEVHCYRSSVNTAQAVFYGFDITRNTTAAIGLNLFKKGLREPHLNEPGSIWIIMSSAATIAGPWLSTGAGKVVAAMKRRNLKKKLKYNPELTIADLTSARKKLRTALAKDGASNVYARKIVRSEIMDDTSGLFQDRVKNELARKEKFRRTAFQQKLASAVIGGQFLAFGTISLNAWQRYGQNKRIIKFNKQLFASNVVGLVGSSMAVGATGAAAIGGEINDWRLRKSKKSALDILDEHIQRLEQVKGDLVQLSD